jgi:hypothetical protein
MVLSDTTLLIGYNDVINYNGIVYDRNSAGLRDNQSDWKRLIGFTAKSGANYNLTERSNVFVNVGYLNRAPLITFVFRPDNQEFKNIDISRSKPDELLNERGIDATIFDCIKDVPENRSKDNRFERLQLVRNMVNPKIGLHILNCAGW